MQRSPLDYRPDLAVDQKNILSLVQCGVFNIISAAKPGEVVTIEADFATGKVRRIEPQPPGAAHAGPPDPAVLAEADQE